MLSRCCSLPLLLTLLCVAAFAGCEKKPQTIKGDEVNDYLADHPELIEASENRDY
ncbi:hypothetical protein [Rhodopirellula sp. SWK7]|uniref:hypothetical protein n=1 Tax=Rhodopirellula sp. SWK7 TaxID=595460 RepID=UPI0002BFE701|nr:hypothetical protein [Rhodopirellula sp. SWK7]EMI42699.1 secreted protein [Rhodopirellula sp. SWK7]